MDQRDTERVDDDGKSESATEGVLFDVPSRSEATPPAVHGSARRLPIAAFVVGVIAFVALRISLAAYKVPSAGMFPAVEVGDHVFVNNLAYLLRAPGRGEMVVFERSEEGAPQAHIKRVLGLPGDTLEFDNGHPIVNGKPLERCLVGTVALEDDFSGVASQVEVYVEFSGAGAYWTAYEHGAESGRQGPYVVAEGEVWVVGDHRFSSHDSRHWNEGRGAGIPFEDVLGRTSFIWLPLARMQVLGSVPVALTRLDPEQQGRYRECMKRR